MSFHIKCVLASVYITYQTLFLQLKFGGRAVEGTTARNTAAAKNSSRETIRLIRAVLLDLSLTVTVCSRRSLILQPVMFKEIYPDQGYKPGQWSHYPQTQSLTAAVAKGAE